MNRSHDIQTNEGRVLFSEVTPETEPRTLVSGNYFAARTAGSSLTVSL
ncbi:MAG TPA: hypothetical protein VHZ55_06050 [Bryobacteraceae bacterium]|nr:hypothetical protein [Bryobacteraceae bacterium]